MPFQITTCYAPSTACYGFNEIDAWWHIALGDHRRSIRRHLRRMGTEVVRIFVFGKPVPDLIASGAICRLCGGDLAAGAVPMVTFAKFQPPYDERNLPFSAPAAPISFGGASSNGAPMRCATGIGASGTSPTTR
jgi:hypothetical protein